MSTIYSILENIIFCAVEVLSTTSSFSATIRPGPAPLLPPVATKLCPFNGTQNGPKLNLCNIVTLDFLEVKIIRLSLIKYFMSPNTDCKESDKFNYFRLVEMFNIFSVIYLITFTDIQLQIKCRYVIFSYLNKNSIKIVYINITLNILSQENLSPTYFFGISNKTYQQHTRQVVFRVDIACSQ